MSFVETQFPTDISYGSEGGPEFKTEIVRLKSGHEKRNIVWEYPLARWNVAYGVKTQELMQALLTFFYARQGRAYGFRFKDHNDFVAYDQEIGTGDGSTTQFQVYRNYVQGGATFARKITKLDAVTVYIDGSPPGIGWSSNLNTGVITFDSPPSSGEVVTATFTFDVPMRFGTDYLATQLADYLAGSASVPLVEMRI